MRVRMLFVSAFLLLGSGSALSQEAAFVVIVHDNAAETRLTAREVSALFLKKVGTWTNGTKVLPVTLKDDSSVTADLSRRIHNRSMQELKAYWQQQIFSGRGLPPPSVDDDAAVLDYVRRHPGAIGYISRASASERRGVKVLTVTEQ